MVPPMGIASVHGLHNVCFGLHERTASIAFFAFRYRSAAVVLGMSDSFRLLRLVSPSLPVLSLFFS